MKSESFDDLIGLETAAPTPAVRHGRLHVMLVDDDPSMRQMVATYLSDYDIRVTALENGNAVAAVLERDSVDLVILDLKLPGENGIQIALRVREQSDVPIVMLTGHKDMADRVMALELGADDYLN